MTRVLPGQDGVEQGGVMLEEVFLLDGVFQTQELAREQGHLLHLPLSLQHTAACYCVKGALYRLRWGFSSCGRGLLPHYYLKEAHHDQQRGEEAVRLQG